MAGAINGMQSGSEQYAEDQAWNRQEVASKTVRVRLTNDENVVTYHHSVDGGKTLVRHPTRMEVAGLNHNVFGGFLSLRVGICALGAGRIRLSRFSHRAIEETA